MSVKVQGLTKIYGAQRAIDSINFEAKKGEILGFLGPNGAGKTTTMKILTCFIPQSEGTAEVGGFDVEKNPLEVRRQVGYLPEHNPLYKERYVREYLEFVAGIHKLDKKKQRVAEMIERVGLGIEQNKPIGALSKGYRQRVGLAQAMLHDPSVLILDEPTNGLDPTGIAEVRETIRTIASEGKTIFMASHILDEVEKVCTHVAIIKNGNLLATGEVGGLLNKDITIEVSCPDNETLKRALSEAAFVSNCKEQSQHLIVHVQEGYSAYDINKWAIEKGIVLTHLQERKRRLEEEFLQITSAS